MNDGYIKAKIDRNKETFLSLLRSINREGIDSLIEWLESTDFFEAPASTKHHSAYPGGLVKHSLNVLDRLCKEVGYASDKVTIAALLHDICKANYYKVSTRNVKDLETGEWKQEQFYSVDDTFPFGHGEKSVYLISKHIELTDEEAMAIRWHMGGFDDSVRGGCFSMSGAFEKYELAVYLHIADMKATYIDEARGDGT